MDALGPDSIQSMLNVLKVYQTEVVKGPEVVRGAMETEPTRRADFSGAFKQAVDGVNDTQMRASEMRAAYERGDNVPLADVVIESQKASLAFEATLQVRNKVLKAYEDIMNMPV